MKTDPANGRQAAGAALGGRWVLLAVVALSLTGRQAWAAQYYVDQGHPAASDANPGTASLPFRTIQRGINAAAGGDTVWVKSGVYEEAVVVTNAVNVAAPITLAAWSNDSVRLGSLLRALPPAAVWQPVPGTRSWSVVLDANQPTDMVVIVNGRAIVTQHTNTPPPDLAAPWATYRAADRTLMVNVGGPNPAAQHALHLARNFTAIRVADRALGVMIKKLEFAWCGTGIDLGGCWITVEDGYFHDIYRHGVWLHGQRNMLLRCNFRDCGYAVGAADSGPINIVEECLVVGCGQTWREDILLRELGRLEAHAAVEFAGAGTVHPFRYNILADNRTAALRYRGTRSMRVIGNAFWDNTGRGGLWNEAGADDTLVIGNYFCRNDVVGRECARVAVAENFFEAGRVVWEGRERWPARPAPMVVRNNAFVAPPGGYLHNRGALGGGVLYSNAFRADLVDFNRCRIPAGSPWVVDGTQTVNNLAALRASYGWEVHGEGGTYNPATNDLTPAAMGGSAVTFRVPWGPRTYLARPLLADGRVNGWPAGPEVHAVSRPPALFWHMSDGNGDNWILQDGYQRWWPHEFRWLMLAAFYRIATNICQWYTDAENVYPRAGVDYSGDLDSRAELSSGNRWLVIEGGTTNGFPGQGLGYRSCWLATVPGATNTVALRLRGRNLLPVGANSAVVRLDFVNATGQNRQSRYLVGRDAEGNWHHSELVSGTYDWTNLQATVVAPTGAVRMALFIGLVAIQTSRSEGVFSPGGGDSMYARAKPGFEDQISRLTLILAIAFFVLTAVVTYMP